MFQGIKNILIIPACVHTEQSRQPLAITQYSKNHKIMPKPYPDRPPKRYHYGSASLFEDFLEWTSERPVRWLYVLIGFAIIGLISKLLSP
jgi:hypothetical protein